MDPSLTDMRLLQAAGMTRTEAGFGSDACLGRGWEIAAYFFPTANASRKAS